MKYQVIAMDRNTHEMRATSRPRTWAECEATYNTYASVYKDCEILIIELP